MRHRRTRRAVLTVALTAAALAVPALTPAAFPSLVGAASADSVDDRKRSVDDQIAQLRDSLEGANAQFVDAAVALQRSQGRLVIARDTLATAQRTLAEAKAKDADLSERLTFAKAEEAKAVDDLADQERTEEQTRTALGQLARQTYQGGEVSGLSIVLQADSADQLGERLAFAGAAMRARNETLDALSVQQAEMRARTTRLTAVRAEVAELKRQSAIVVEQRRAAEQAAADAENEISDLVAEQQQAVATLQDRIDAEKKRLEELSSEQSRLQSMLAERARRAREEERRRQQQAGNGSGGHSGGGGSDGAPASSGGFMRYPSSAPVSSSFGMRYHPILHIWRMHTGTDFAAPCGSPVYAAADGEIISAGWAGGYGNRIVIDHGYVRGVGLASTYNHLTRFVRSGGSVSQGQLIAYSGTTGLSTGCHLHFEVLADGRYVNPMNWF